MDVAIAMPVIPESFEHHGQAVQRLNAVPPLKHG